MKARKSHAAMVMNFWNVRTSYPTGVRRGSSAIHLTKKTAPKAGGRARFKPRYYSGEVSNV
jgi:hypothetical protein